MIRHGLGTMPPDEAPSKGIVSGRGYEVGKRVVDLAVATSVGLLASPFLAAAAVVIKVEGGGRILFRQERIGRHGQPFRILKFRTLVDAPVRDNTDYLISKSDARLTPVGAFCAAGRSTSCPSSGTCSAGR